MLIYFVVVNAGPAGAFTVQLTEVSLSGLEFLPTLVAVYGDAEDTKSIKILYRKQ